MWGIYFRELQPFLVPEQMLREIIKQFICKQQEDKNLRNS